MTNRRSHIDENGEPRAPAVDLGACTCGRPWRSVDLICPCGVLRWYFPGDDDPRYAATRYLCEATGFEQSGALWTTWSKWSPWRYDIQRRNDARVEWEQTNPGHLITIGTLDGMPVCVHVCWTWIERELVCFWEMTSLVQDYRMAEKWLEETFPKKNLYQTANAQNFHNIVGEIRHRREKR